RHGVKPCSFSASRCLCVRSVSSAFTLPRLSVASCIMAPMKQLLFAALVLAPASALAQQHAECSHLTMLKFPEVTISEAVAVPAATTGAIRAAHCRVN